MTGSKQDSTTPRLVEYPPNEPFPGVIGRTLDESTPAWPAPVRAKPGAPNVILFMWDDVGYGQMSPFGGFCNTPNLDRLAERGLRYSNFHTTALCSPTRASLLTGRNHHTLGMSAITNMALGFPAHNSFMPFEHGMVSEILVEQGYNTFALGKWHLTPATEATAAGPYHRWPLGRGYERFYGFLDGETDQWFPNLVHDNHWVPQPATPEAGYHLNVDLADHAISFVKDAHVNAPDKPFFMYYSTGAGHAPHHVEPEWIERQRGRFDIGWDEVRRQIFERQKAIGLVPPDATMTESDPDVPAWNSLSDEARQMYAHQMEVFAAFIEQTDYHFGRLLDFLEQIDELDNTIVIVMSDNGASAEGGVHGTFNESLFFNAIEETLEDNLERADEWGTPNTYPHYAWGWAWAGDTPFRRWKRETYRGGVTDPCIVSWPAGIADQGQVRTQYLHVVDIVPTLLDMLGIDPPATIRGVPQSEIQGVSFAHTFSEPSAPTRHTTQYFEMFGNRSIYHDGWKANCPITGPSFAEGLEMGRRFGDQLTADLLVTLDATGWELYDVGNDPAETANLAETEPERLQQMIELWYSEAGRYGVFPLAAANLARFRMPKPQLRTAVYTTVWYPDAAPVIIDSAPRVLNRSHTIIADATIPEDGARGVLVTHGGRLGGYSLFVDDEGHLVYVHNYVGLQQFVVRSPQPVPVGDVKLGYDFEVTGVPHFSRGVGAPGMGRLLIDDQRVAEMELPITIPGRIGSHGFSCGYAAYDSVLPDVYQAPYRFTGTLRDVVVHTHSANGAKVTDDAQAIKNAIAEQ